MEFVRLYLAKLHEKRTKLTFNCDRLSTGLQKLAESNELVGAMQTELMQLGPKLEQKAKVLHSGSFQTDPRLFYFLGGVQHDRLTSCLVFCFERLTYV